MGIGVARTGTSHGVAPSCTMGAVRERRGTGAWSMLLSHCGPNGLDRCLALPLGRRAVLLCARCAGLYPALLAAAAARLAGADLPGLEGPAVRLTVPLAGGAAWVAEQAGLELGKPLRVASGVALGLGIGWPLALHLRSPWPGELVELVAALALVLAAGLAARRLALGRRRRRIDPESR